MNNNNDTHNPDNHPVWDSFSPNNPVWTENEDGSGQWSDGWNGDTPELDSSDENNYDDENDSWSDGDSLASAGWGTDEDYGNFGDDQ